MKRRIPARGSLPALTLPLPRRLRMGLGAVYNAHVRSITRVAVLAVLLGSAACSDRADPTVSTDVVTIEPVAGLVATQEVEIPPAWLTVQRFSVDLNVSGTLTPGSVIRVSATATAELPTGTASFTLSLPEVESAKLSAWDRGFTRPKDVPLISASRSIPSLARAQQAQLTHVFSVPVPGVYQVVARAVAPEGEVTNADGIVLNQTVKTVWLVVEEGGGRVVDTFTPDLLADGFLKEAGPRRARRSRGRSIGRASIFSALTSLFSYARELMMGQGYHNWMAMYFDVDTSTFRTLPGAEFDVTIYEGQTPVGSYSGITDIYGEFLIPCTSGEVEIGNVRTQNADVLVVGGLGRIDGDVFNGECSAFGEFAQPFPMVVDNQHAEVFRNVSTRVPSIESFFGASRNQIRVELTTDTENSHYEAGPDKIVIKLPDHIWGPFREFTHVHEFGHAFHRKALGISLPGNCPSVHNIDEASNASCAYTEGFADYVGAWFTGYLGSFFASGAWQPDKNGVTDGNIIEGAFASWLWNMGVYSGTYIADVIATCRVVAGSVLTPATGPDHFTYCFENRIDSLVTGNPAYFPGRVDPTLFLEDATEPGNWNADNIRTVWVNNLYGN